MTWIHRIILSAAIGILAWGIQALEIDVSVSFRVWVQGTLETLTSKPK